MKGLRVLCAVCCFGFSQSVLANGQMLQWPPLQGKTGFTQLKSLQGLPVPLRSSGTIELQEAELLWHTTAPVEQKLKISAAGVSQWQQQDYVALAGSEFVGQLMLAVLHQDLAFIQQHFSLQGGIAHCTLLQPRQAPLNQLFRQIELCGEQQLQQLTLQEVNGNKTVIALHPEPGAQ
jgi:hypothetical protein